jgi:glycosyltransferase involved in cell wall biosynthesis
MNHNKPRLSIGLPVYNGAQYLEQSLNSLLHQSYSNFELILSDNASTDSTGSICQAYAAKDKRIRYYRNEKNIGANPNFNRVFELSSGTYFKWAACDDIHDERFIERCIEVLDNEPSVVLCYTRTEQIDENGVSLGPLDFELDAASPSPNQRFYNMIHVDHWCFQIFGVIRSETLRKTPRLGQHYGADRVLLAEISLHGRFHEIPEYLFKRRNHGGTSWQIVHSRDKLELASYLGSNSAAGQMRFLGIKNFQGYASAIHRAPLGWSEKLKCYSQLMRLIIEKSAHRLKKNKC